MRLQTRTTIVLVMAHLTASVEYGLHCLVWLVRTGEAALSSRDLADLQGVSPSFVAKIFPKLEKAGIVAASEGLRGGYRLAKPADQINFLDIIDAIEGPKPIFDCQNVRHRCALFDQAPPSWATQGVCSIHAVILAAERAMRAELGKHSLADLAAASAAEAPAHFAGDVQAWIDDRVTHRTARARDRPPDG